MSVYAGFYVSIWNTKLSLEDTQNETTVPKKAHSKTFKMLYNFGGIEFSHQYIYAVAK